MSLEQKEVLDSLGDMKMFITALTTLFFLPFFAFAKSVEVVNNISTLVNTGGNSANNGEVIEGESESRVKVYTKVNEEVLEDFDQTFEDEIEFEFESKKEIPNAKVETKIEVKAGVGSSTNFSREASDTEENVSKFNLDIIKRRISQKVSQILNYVFSFFTF